MAQQLQVLAAPAEGQNLVFSIHMVHIYIHTKYSKDIHVY